MNDEGSRAPALLVGVVVFASTATWLAAFLATSAGALRPWVAAASLAAGLFMGLLAAWHLRCGATPPLVSDPGLPSAADASPSRRRLSTLEVLALAAFAVVSLRQFGWLLCEVSGELRTFLSYNYGDLPLHWTYIRYFANGAPFWPENPILSGERLRYPLGVDLLSASFLALGVGMRALLPLMGLAGAALTALALRRWGGALAVAGFLFSGGLAGFELLWTGRLADYQASVAWKNLYLALFVPQRGLLLALPVGLVLLRCWRRRLLREGPGLPAWIEGTLWGALPLIHLHTFLVASFIYAAWSVGTSKLKAAWPSLAWAVLPATWAVWQVTDGFRAASLVGWKPGWTMGEANPLVFLLMNFGLFLPLALGALALAWRARRREELLVLGPALVLFALLFFVRLAPWEWDNTKVMMWCYLLALPPIASLVLQPLGGWWRAAAVFGLLFSGFVCVTAASLGPGARLDVLDVKEYEAVCQALSTRPPSERVAVEPTFNHPVALCGHPVVAGYGGHLWSHGLDASRVEHRLATLLQGGPSWRAEAHAIGADLLFWGWREQAAHPQSSRPWEKELAPLAAGRWGALYRLE